MVVALAVIACAGCARLDDGASGDPQALIVTGHCSVSALGVMPSGEAITGNIRDTGTAPTGSWQSSATGSSLVGTPNWLQCRVNGSTVADFTGTGTWNGAPGYTFRVHVQDRGTPGAPTRVEGPPTTATIVATRNYSPTRWTDGTASWAAGAYATVPNTLPVTVGNAANQWAWVTFAPDPGGAASLGYAVRCRYRGGARGQDPDSASDIAAGLSYHFVDCQRPCADAHDDDDADAEHHHDGDEHGGHLYARGDDHHACEHDDDDGEHDDWCTDTAIIAGAELQVASATVHVHNGANDLPDRHAAQTTVTLGLAVTPFVFVAPENDFYRLAVWDPAGTLVHSADGDLSSGDIVVSLLP